MKTVFFGATGFVGKSVLKRFVQQSQANSWNEQQFESRKVNKTNEAELGSKHKIVVCSRQETLALQDWLEKLTGLNSDLNAIEARSIDVMDSKAFPKLVEILRGATSIYHSVQFPGHPIERKSKGYTYLNYDFGSLKRVVDAWKQANDTQSICKLIYVSGAGAGQGRNEVWYQAKDKAESLLQQTVKECPNFKFLSLRPSVVFGQDDISVQRLLLMGKKFGVIPLFDKGSVRLFPIWVEDLARVLVEGGILGNLTGSLDYPGPEEVTFKKLLERSFSYAKMNPAFVSAPKNLVKAFAPLLGVLPKPPLSADAVDFLTTGPSMEIPTSGELHKYWVEQTPLDYALGYSFRHLGK